MWDDIKFSRGCVAAFALVGAFWGVFGALVPDLKAQGALNDAAFGSAMLVSALGGLVAMWLAPQVVPKLGRHNLFWLSLLLLLMFALPGLGQSWTGFALLMVLVAMGSGLLDVLMNAQLAGLEERSSRTLMSLNHGMYSVSYAVFAILTGAVRELGWPPLWVFLAMGVFGVPLLWLTRQVTADVSGDHSATSQDGGLPWALIVLAGAALLVAFLAEQGVEGWSALHLERGLNAGALQGSLGPALLGITMAIGRLSGHIVISRFDQITLLLLAASFAAGGCFLAAWATALGLAYLGFAALGLGVSVIVPICIGLVGAAVSGPAKTKAISRVTMIGYTGFFIGPPLIGGVSHLTDLTTAFSLVAVLLLAVAIFLAPALRSRTAPPYRQ